MSQPTHKVQFNVRYPVLPSKNLLVLIEAINNFHFSCHFYQFKKKLPAENTTSGQNSGTIL